MMCAPAFATKQMNSDLLSCVIYGFIVCHSVIKSYRKHGQVLPSPYHMAFHSLSSVEKTLPIFLSAVAASWLLLELPKVGMLRTVVGMRKNLGNGKIMIHGLIRQLSEEVHNNLISLFLSAFRNSYFYTMLQGEKCM